MTTPFRLVLCVHDLSETPVATGDERRCWLPVSHFRPFLRELDAALATTGVPLEITSDDAFISDYKDLMPLLIESGRRATFFVPTAFVGRAGRLSVAQLREMQALGMRIGTHGVDHVNWAAIGPAARTADIARSIATLEDWLGAKVTSAAPPFGAYDRATVAELTARGITEIHTCNGGFAHVGGPLRTRVALADEPAINAGILALAGRQPGAKDRLRTLWHRAKAGALPLPYAPRRAAAVSSAAS